MWFIGVEVEQETSAPPRKKNPWIRPWSLNYCGVYNVTDPKLRKYWLTANY